MARQRDLKSRITFSLVARIAGGLANLAFTVMLGRMLGPAETGLFLVGFATAGLVATAGRLGLEQIVIREVAPLLAAGDTPEAQAIYTKILRMGVSTATLLGLACWIGAHPAAIFVFEKPTLEPVFQWFAVAVVPITAASLHASFLHAAKRAESGLAVLNFWQPMLALIGILIVPEPSSSVASGIYLVASMLTLLIAIRQWRRLVSPSSLAVVESEHTLLDLLRAGFPLLVTNFCLMILLWAAMLLIGVWADPEEVGGYGVAHRLGLVISGFLLSPIDAVLAPRFAELRAIADLASMERLAQKVSVVLIAVLTPVWLVIALVPEYILQVFGTGFSSGAAALVILATGQLFNVATGSVRLLLIMNGKEIVLRNCMIGAMITNLLLCALLIPNMGAVGAALATAITIAGEKLVELVVVYRQLRINVIPIRGW